MKYVIVEQMGAELPMMFPECMTHDTCKDMKCVSAGKFDLKWDEKTSEFRVSVHGSSTSLGLSSRKEDADIIEVALKFKEW